MLGGIGIRIGGGPTVMGLLVGTTTGVDNGNGSPKIETERLEITGVGSGSNDCRTRFACSIALIVIDGSGLACLFSGVFS